jgi:hypothetical protein
MYSLSISYEGTMQTVCIEMHFYMQKKGKSRHPL